MSGSGRFERAGQPAGAQTPDWLAIERSPEFKELVETRRRIITPLTVIWLVVSLGYLFLAAFVPGVMGWQVTDGLPFAWLAAITQVILTWAVTWSGAQDARIAAAKTGDAGQARASSRRART